jgi:hypothetical protein
MIGRDAERFLTQNEDFATTLTPDDMEAVEQHAEHHAGGLYVLWRWLGDDWSVKAHESWGGPDEDGRNMVVHVYNVEDPDHDTVTYFRTGHEAVAAFLTVPERGD